MKKLTSTLAAICACGMFAGAQVIDLSSPPAGFTVTNILGGGSHTYTTGTPEYAANPFGGNPWGLTGTYDLSYGDGVVITFDYTRDVSFQILDLDLSQGGGAADPETALITFSNGAVYDLSGTVETATAAEILANPITISEAGVSSLTILMDTPTTFTAAMAISNFTIPEPSTALLGALGMVALLRRRR